MQRSRGGRELATDRLRDGRIGRYQLVKRMAAGGMADIYLAQRFGPQGYENTVVVKMIREDLIEEDDVIQTLMAEARIAACLQHENIVRLLEVGEESGVRFLAMEFVFGRDLHRVMDRCLEVGVAMPIRHVVTILADVLDALSHAHVEAELEGRPLRLIHRDVSPQNILVGFDGSTKLLDFGLAKTAALLSRTHAGVLKGKYAYMAPEQVKFGDVDQRADLFSTGVVLWEAMTLERLFARSNDYETVQAVGQCRVPFIRGHRADVPWNLAWATFWSLRRSPRWRYRSAAAMRAALLRDDHRSRKEAREELSDWMEGLFARYLAAREVALARAWRDPLRFRALRDAGFELLDETTDPEMAATGSRRSLNRVAGTGGDERSPVLTGWAGVLSSLVASQRWFVSLFAFVALLCAGFGVYIGSSSVEGPQHGYLYVFANVDEVEVSVGATRLGRAPVQRVAVLPGVHKVLGTRGGLKSEVEVDVKAGENRVVKLEFHVAHE